MNHFQYVMLYIFFFVTEDQPIPGISSTLCPVANNKSDDEHKSFNEGDKSNVIYILLLPLANVLLSIIIVHFTWEVISGRDMRKSAIMRKWRRT